MCFGDVLQMCLGDQSCNDFNLKAQCNVFFFTKLHRAFLHQASQSQQSYGSLHGMFGKCFTDMKTNMTLEHHHFQKEILLKYGGCSTVMLIFGGVPT